ncbi:alpha/beta-hydrolase [Amniculicola lignicola CBS 123094]|uniref:Alpha/beta-hydrolase n=1 Tax=Amniculicola lignicola CBS 123094 TaxID=1392246 RepID=A0A6A5X1F9_9PLEO|nr:alpha/beta-hydrolase [Amniculicola lignicola CBS 123094]
MAHLTREEVLKSGEVSPEYEKAFTNHPFALSATSFLDHRAKRAAHLAKLRHLYPIPGPIPSHVTETMHDVPTRDGSSIRVRVYQPVKGPPEGGSPLIVMYHEGGWSMGDLTDEDQNCRLFARDLGAVCVNVEYRLAPEYPFPAPINDCWDALNWALTNASTLNATPTRGLIVGGASAGGNIAAVMALLSRDTSLSPPITGQYLCVPALLSPESVPPSLAHLYKSRVENISDPVLGKLDASGIMEVYKPDPTSFMWDPFNHEKGLKGVAKTYFQVGGLDPLRDEAVLYDRKLRTEGVLTRFDLYAGFGHMFWTNWPEMETSRRFVEDTVKGVGWLLEE